MLTQVVEQVLDALREDFAGSDVAVTPDGSGGCTVVIEPVDLGPQYSPGVTWLGAHLSSALPFADVYPLFVGASVKKASGAPHGDPVAAVPSFAGRPALQVSRRTNNRMATVDAAAAKFLKVLHFLRELAP